METKPGSQPGDHTAANPAGAAGVEHKAVKIPITAEVYPYANPVSRQAIGITNEANGAAGDAAYSFLYSGAAPLADDVILMGESVYSLRSIAPYSPIQLVIADTGMTEAQYLEERGVSHG